MKKWLFLLRSFFPSWRLFDDVGVEFRLEARHGSSDSALGPWLDCLPPIRRSWKNVVVNADGNFLHACRNLLALLSSDIQDCDSPDAILERATYVTTRNLVEYRLSETRPAWYQFRLLVISPDGTKDAEPILLSPIQPWPNGEHPS